MTNVWLKVAISEFRLSMLMLILLKHYGPVAQSSVKSAGFKSDLEVYQTRG